MKFFDWLFNAGIHRKENPTSQIIVMGSPGGGSQAISSKADYGSFAKEGYSRNDVVYRCVNEIATGAASIPWFLQRKLSDGTLDEIDSHPLLDLINRPNPLQSRAQFIQWLVSYLEISGNAYIVSAGPTDTRRPPLELWLLRPDRVKVIPHPIEMVSGYEYKVGGESVVFDRDQVLHLKLFNPLDDFYGMSPIQAAALAIDKLNNTDEWNARLLNNAAVPSGALVANNRLTDDQFGRLKQELADEIGGKRNARKPLLLEEGIEWKEMGMNPRDMDFVKGSKMSASQIARVYGVPLETVGLIDGTFDNRKAARRSLFGETILPLLDNVVIDGFNSWLTPKYEEGLVLAKNTDGVEALAEDQKELWERVDKVSFLAINEKRAITGYEPHPDGDVILTDANKIPLSDVVAGASDDDPENDLGDDGKFLSELYGCKAHEGFGPGVDCKVFSGPEKKRFRRLFIQVARQRDSLARKLRRRIEKLLKEESGILANAYREQGQGEAVSILSRRAKEKWLPALKNHHLAVMSTFAPQALNQLKSDSSDLQAKADAFDDAEDLFQQIALRFAQDNAAQAVGNITDATRSQLASVVEAGIEEGLGTVEIAEQIREKLEDGSKKRALTIARTETHNAQNEAQLEQVKALAQDGLQKGWLWSGVSRSEHAGTDGSWVDLNQTFSVAGKQMSRPGDSAGGPENVINCSCTLVFRRKP